MSVICYHLIALVAQKVFGEAKFSVTSILLKNNDVTNKEYILYKRNNDLYLKITTSNKMHQKWCLFIKSIWQH